VPTRLLAEEIARYETLLDLLERESEALCRVDARALEDAANAKFAVVGELERLEAERHDALTKECLPHNDIGMRQWLARLEGDAACAAWERLRDLAFRARDANARNGRMLERSRRHFASALRALLGAAGVPEVYDAGGTARALATSRVRVAT